MRSRQLHLTLNHGPGRLDQPTPLSTYASARDAAGLSASPKSSTPASSGSELGRWFCDLEPSLLSNPQQVDRKSQNAHFPRTRPFGHPSIYRRYPSNSCAKPALKDRMQTGLLMAVICASYPFTHLVVRGARRSNSVAWPTKRKEWK